MAEDEPTFVTATELREREARAAVEDHPGSDGADDSATDEFAIPARPDRRYPRGGGVEYVGGTVFSFDPGVDRTDGELATLLVSVLDSGTYRYGDWFDLPMPLYLVRDDSTHDTFRVAVRDGRVEVHVLPETDPEGVRALHDRLAEAGEDAFEWTVERRVEEP
ncbi:MAG: hypothetical protein V5A62_01160 [Haloarculaceae archaeon]